MLTKILMCSGYTEYFHNEEHEYVKKFCYFYGHCKEEHVYFVHTCKYYPFVAKNICGMKSKYFCAGLEPCEICEFWNFCASKFCLRNIPKNIQQHLVPLDDFFNKQP